MFSSSYYNVKNNRFHIQKNPYYANCRLECCYIVFNRKISCYVCCFRFTNARDGELAMAIGTPLSHGFERTFRAHQLLVVINATWPLRQFRGPDYATNGTVCDTLIDQLERFEGGSSTFKSKYTLINKMSRIIDYVFTVLL